ncbi:MAG: hypothetical protein WC824_05725 [Bacteroidota bacterium]
MAKTDNQEFADVWNASQSLLEVAGHFGLSKRAVTVKASWMRSQGWKLQKFLEKNVPMRNLRKDLTGLRFGILTVIQRMPNQGGDIMYECLCDCGKQTIAIGYNIHKGFTQSCGCMRQRTGKNNPNWRGHGEIPLQYWTGVHIGATRRGLRVHVSIEDVWNLFLTQARKCAISGVPLNFAGYNSGKEQTASLDRIDSTIGYENGNLQWVHKDMQWMKGTFTQQEFLDWIRVIATNQKMDITSATPLEAPRINKSSRWSVK